MSNTDADAVILDYQCELDMSVKKIIEILDCLNRREQLFVMAILNDIMNHHFSKTSGMSKPDHVGDELTDFVGGVFNEFVADVMRKRRQARNQPGEDKPDKGQQSGDKPGDGR